MLNLDTTIWVDIVEGRLEPRHSCEYSNGMIEDLQQEVRKLRRALALLIVETNCLHISELVEKM